MEAVKIKGAFYDCPNGQIHYRYTLTKADIKQKPVLRLHMSAASSLYYESLMNKLTTAGHDCYVPDMSGSV
jgi:hypothetical protein